MDINNNPVMDSRNSWKFIGIHNCIMDTHKSIMDFHKCMMCGRNCILKIIASPVIFMQLWLFYENLMDIHNCIIMDNHKLIMDCMMGSHNCILKLLHLQSYSCNYGYS